MAMLGCTFGSALDSCFGQLFWAVPKCSPTCSDVLSCSHWHIEYPMLASAMLAAAAVEQREMRPVKARAYLVYTVLGTTYWSGGQ